MNLYFLALKDSINKAFRLIKPQRKGLDLFKANLSKLLANLDEKESEENVKVHLMDFLKNTYYHPDHLVAQKGKTDFVIHLEKDAKSPAGVLFEVKRPSNKTEMVSKDNLNAKAMHELILYFLRERFTNKNHSLTHLVITNVYEWFVFDASEFENVFSQNSSLVKSYREWEAGQKISSKTDLFYKEIVKPFLDENDKKISFVHFDIRDYQKHLKANKENDNTLIALYKFFTPINLLKLPFINDSNSLDKGFFSELLHIIGLEEVKESGRKIIRRLPEDKRVTGSLLENTINILEVDRVVQKLGVNSQYGKTKDEQLFGFALELCITWINRILFLKLLEAQLLRYHNGNKKFRFLNNQTIKDYDELYKLFFQVLARQNAERSDSIKQKYAHIPYLNSSLFEISDLEDQTIKINSLDDNLEIKLYSNSILKQRLVNKDLDAKNTLHYLFEFLDAYDFSSFGREEVQEENKTIINAAVLGLVFEKINGYKDGSIYTPGAVTMFLCKETIRKAVVKKFNDIYGWSCETIKDVKNHIAEKRNQKDILAFNSVVESVKIADPAVGSGHFLVSSLNEIITIKAELGILADKEGGVLSEIEVSIANDELIVTYKQTQDFFEYIVNETTTGEHKISDEIQRIQETLFNEKRKIIEGCLFGVDINPNSVKICQLRLWIELLKHAYYRSEEKYSELETLPNIDINIKTGNSLLNKYALTEDLSDVFKKQKYSAKDYRKAVQDYKETPNKEAKERLKSFFKAIKEEFKESVGNRDPKRRKLNELKAQLLLTQNNVDLFGEKKSKEELDADVVKITQQINKIEKEIIDIETNVIYKNAFEWRFEFPEVLNEKGDFEGFEVIIGNPPYIQLQKMGADADALQQCGYKTFARTGDLYCLFYEQATRLLKEGYFFGYITSNKWMRANYGEATRRFFLDETNPLLLVDFGGFQVFDAATVDANILISQKANYDGEVETCVLDKSMGSLEKMSVYISQSKTLQKDFLPEKGWVILSPIEASIKRKIEAVGVPLKDWDINIYRGILTGYNKAFIIDGKTKDELIKASPKNAEIIRPILLGKNIKRYSYTWDDTWVIFTRRGIDISKYPTIEGYLSKYYLELRPKNNGEGTGRKPGTYKWYEIQDPVSYFTEFEKTKIGWGNLALNSQFCFIDKGFYINAPSAFIATDKIHLLGILNSKVANFYIKQLGVTRNGGYFEYKPMFVEQFPIPKLTIEQENKLKNLAENINRNENASVIEVSSEIDKLMYDFYKFEKHEIDLIDSKH